jgi:hypothetical protein
MQPVSSLDRAGRRRSPATLASFHEGRAPHNKGLRYPPDPSRTDQPPAVLNAGIRILDPDRRRELENIGRLLDGDTAFSELAERL